MSEEPTSYDETSATAQTSATDQTTDTAQPPAPDPALRRKSRVAVLRYGLARLGLFVALTVLIHLVVVLVDAPVPLLVSAMLALFVALPLSMLVFTKLRVQAVETLAAYSAQRKAHKQWVEQELAGR